LKDSRKDVIRTGERGGRGAIWAPRWEEKKILLELGEKGERFHIVGQHHVAKPEPVTKKVAERSVTKMWGERSSNNTRAVRERSGEDNFTIDPKS